MTIGNNKLSEYDSSEVSTNAFEKKSRAVLVFEDEWNKKVLLKKKKYFKKCRRDAGQVNYEEMVCCQHKQTVTWFPINKYIT